MAKQIDSVANHQICLRLLERGAQFQVILEELSVNLLTGKTPTCYNSDNDPAHFTHAQVIDGWLFNSYRDARIAFENLSRQLME